jgi:HlyD family secretion protein
VTAQKSDVITIPIQALAMRAPDDGKSKGGNAVQAATAANSTQKQVQGVFVVRNDNGKLRVHFVPVNTGITGTTDIEVTGGLQPGDEIVTGTFQVLRDLKDNSLVKRDTTPVAPPPSSSS